MEKIITPRGGGKTMLLIKRSAKTGESIVCYSLKEARELQHIAKKVGVSIPQPLTYEDLIERNYVAKDILGLLVDNVDRLVQYMAGAVPVSAITMTAEEKDLSADYSRLFK